jgi:membrane protease YdiL (CAAX protease family)
VWTVSFLAIVLASAIAPGWAKLVATVSFLYLPQWGMRRRNEDYRDLGITLRNWRQDAKLAAIVFFIVAPLFVLAYAAFAHLLPLLPKHWAMLLSPHLSVPHLAFRLPKDFALWVVDQLLVVALPEEFFYRGYVQSRLKEAWPPGGKTFLGIAWGRAFFATAALFALGHLAIFQAWRLAVFFPALLFGWLRERTGTVMGAALLHAGFNLMQLVLEASFYGR